MKRLLAVAAVVAMFGMTTNSADAGGVRFYWGGGYGNGCYSRPYYFPNNYNYGWGGGYGNGYGGHGWHNTSHYDYHPGGYVPHGNHLDYVPGHYDYHNTGHWDHIGGYGGYGHHH